MCPLKDDGELQNALFKVLLLPKFYQRKSIDFNLQCEIEMKVKITQLCGTL